MVSEIYGELFTRDDNIMKRFFLAAACLALSATTASATLYSCSVQEQGSRSGWVPQTVLLAVRDDGVVFVSDPIGAAIAGEPAEAAVLNDSGQSLSVRWQVRGALSATNQYAHFFYTAIIDKSRGSIRVRAKPKGYSNQFNGTGRCQVGEIPS